MIRILGTIFAGLLGLAFGSFLNVCLSRWPQSESVVQPRSHCRNCSHTLAWWENIPLVSWVFLGGRCRNCRAWIGLRYPLVELAVGVLWAIAASEALILIQNLLTLHFSLTQWIEIDIFHLFGNLVFVWLLAALLFLDAEHLWLPDKLTLPSIFFGFIYRFGCFLLDHNFALQRQDTIPSIFATLLLQVLSILAAAGLILLIRWVYWLIRRREGVGLGDAKLMALLAAWLGLPGALLAFSLGVVLGAVVSLALLAVPSARSQSESWAVAKVPLGTFLCIGGVVSALWGGPLIAAYLHWAGF
jgi:leader peptidase (prepilin peptidase)/N-methyltransferase